jgi:3-phosphoshikimate 1-carboxyvinyltransferase
VSQPVELAITGPRPLHGRLRMPGDKGISHRALLFAAIAHGTSHVTDVATGADVQQTRRAIEALGVRVHADDNGHTIVGNGFEGLREPDDVIDCGNSGTTMRMLAGLLAAAPFVSVLTGDASLRGRPMARVVDPLRAMGAAIEGRDDGRLAPLVVHGRRLHGTQLTLQSASGQVKTALTLAALQADGVTEITEPTPSRDHTERLLTALGAPIEVLDRTRLRVSAGAVPAFDLTVPGDPSSAAFFVVAALITPGSDLRAMGADIDVRASGEQLGEPVGDLRVRASALVGTTFSPREAVIDEVPVLAVAAAFAAGTTQIREASELRVKESDRIATVAQELTELGAEVEADTDGLLIRGGTLRPGIFKSHGDHRVAMAAAVAANALSGESRIRGWQSVAVSYPAFGDDLASLAAAPG